MLSILSSQVVPSSQAVPSSLTTKMDGVDYSDSALNLLSLEVSSSLQQHFLQLTLVNKHQQEHGSGYSQQEHGSDFSQQAAALWQTRTISTHQM